MISLFCKMIQSNNRPISTMIFTYFIPLTSVVSLKVTHLYYMELCGLKISFPIVACNLCAAV